MAWDLRYTSAESGPTGRSGFQFVATTPGTPSEVTRAVTPYMRYRPPPSAPSAPGPEELAAFPVSFAYAREGDNAVIARCRYTGRDYSGRHGNFAGHAVVATAQEMEGLRPIELWESPVWSGPPGGTPELVPGEAFDPYALVSWLEREKACDRLATLLDAVTAALAGGHGRVVLVSRDTGLIARWIALLSYSLPASLAARMSFTTYTPDPDAAPQLVVGTVPDARPRDGAFDLDEPAAGGREPCRFARVVAGCWRTGALDGIDAVGELLDQAGGALEAADGAAALLALCQGDGSVSPAEEATAARLVRRAGAPAWVWPALSGALPRIGFDLAAELADVAPQVAEHCVALALADPGLHDRLPAFRLRDGMPSAFRDAVAHAGGLGALAAVVRLADQVGGRLDTAEVSTAAAACARRGDGPVAAALDAVPGAWRQAMVSGVLAGLETADAATRRAMLDADAVTALGDHDWTRSPRTGGLVLSTGADRLEATAGLVDLERHGLPDAEDLLAALWADPPSPTECARLVERLGPAFGRFTTLRRLTRRVFDDAPLDAEETVRLAGLIRDLLPDLAGPALIVLAHREALRTVPEEEVARILGRMDAREPLTGRARASVAAALAHRPARTRAGVLTAAPEPVRSELAGHWLDAGPDKGGRVDLAEIEVRLHRAGTPVDRLTEWNDGLGRFARRHVESALTDRDPDLASAWRALRRRGA